MDQILSQLGIILVVGVILGLIAALTGLFAAKSQKLNEEHGYDPAWDKSELACQGCKLVGVCNGMAKLKPEMTAEELRAEIHKNHETKCGQDPILDGNPEA